MDTVSGECGNRAVERFATFARTTQRVEPALRLNSVLQWQE